MNIEDERIDSVRAAGSVPALVPSGPLRRPAALVTTALILWACGGGDLDLEPPPSFSQKDSAGIAILTTPASEAMAPLACTIGPVPHLVLGAEDDPAGPFVRIDAVRHGPGGGVLVLDAGRRELLRFDAKGNALGRTGRLGRGPGEFVRPRLLKSPWRDSLFVFDPDLARVTVYTTELDLVRVEPMPSPGGTRFMPTGAVAGGWIGEDRMFNGVTIEAAMMQEGSVEESTAVRLHDRDGHYRVTLSSTSALRWVVSEAFGRRGEMGHLPIRLVPHAPSMSWAVEADRVLVSDGHAFEIRVVKLDGEPDRILRIDSRPDPMRPEMLEAWVRREAGVPEDAPVGPERMATYDRVPLPERLPAFDKIIMDVGANIWARVYPWDTRSEDVWMVFHAAGKALGYVYAPTGFTAHSIDDESMVGVWRGALGEEFVFAFQMHGSCTEFLNPPT